jgi:pyridoxamine 5'-phosphate oxidase
VEDARAAGLPEHDAVALATTGASGRPTARIVSVRRVEAASVVFTTALWTRKARDLRDNPHVALLFHWSSLGRQAQVGGRAAIAERALAEEIFAERDRPHQLQSMVSRQGEPIADLAALRERWPRRTRAVPGAVTNRFARRATTRSARTVVRFAAPGRCHDRLGAERIRATER